MNQPIMVTPYELWTMVLALCAGIVAISGAVTVILKVILETQCRLDWECFYAIIQYTKTTD